MWFLPETKNQGGIKELKEGTIVFELNNKLLLYL